MDPTIPATIPMVIEEVTQPEYVEQLAAILERSEEIAGLLGYLTGIAMFGAVALVFFFSYKFLRIFF